MTAQLAEEVASNIKAASEGHNADILITTSRRTNSAAEEALKKEFKGYPRCKLLIIANERNMPDPVPGMFGLSSIIVVSGDSVSMVSEAVQSAKYVIVFMPKAKRGIFRNKKIEFLKRLEGEGRIKLTEPARISDAIRDILN